MPPTTSQPESCELSRLHVDLGHRLLTALGPMSIAAFRVGHILAHLLKYFPTPGESLFHTPTFWEWEVAEFDVNPPIQTDSRAPKRYCEGASMCLRDRPKYQRERSALRLLRESCKELYEASHKQWYYVLWFNHPVQVCSLYTDSMRSHMDIQAEQFARMHLTNSTAKSRVCFLRVDMPIPERRPNYVWGSDFTQWPPSNTRVRYDNYRSYRTGPSLFTKVYPGSSIFYYAHSFERRSIVYTATYSPNSLTCTALILAITVRVECWPPPLPNTT